MAVNKRKVRKEEFSSESAEKESTSLKNGKEVKNQEIVRAKVGAEGELPFIEKFVYFCVYSYFLAIAVYKIYSFPLGKCIFTSN